MSFREERESPRPPQFPLRVSADGRFLEDSAGVPFYFAGDTHWPLLWHYSLDEARLLIDDRVAKGFSALLVSVAPFGNRPNVHRNSAFRDLRSLRINEEYFVHADRVLDYAASKGLAIYAIALWWSNYHEHADVEALATYGRWLGERWADRQNIIWALGGDERFRREDTPRFRALAQSIRAGRASQLMTFHPHGGLPFLSAGNSAAGHLNDEPWLDFSSVQAHAFGGRMVDRVLAD